MNEVATRTGALTEQQMFDAAGVSQETQFLNVIERMASNPAVDVTKLSAILDMQERIIAKRAESEFNEAFAALSPELPRIKKNKGVSYDGGKKEAFKFAEFSKIDEAVRPLLNKHGFSVSFTTAPRQGDGGGIRVIGTLLHKGGHSKSAEIPLALDSSGGKNNIQGMGSTFSYGRRYTLVMLLNLITDDDDDGVMGGTVFITPAQKDELIGLIRDTKTDTKAFLKFTGTQSIDEIEAKNFAGAVQRLRQKLHKMQGEPA